MIEAKADPPNQLLRINFVGHVDADEARRNEATVGALLSGLQPGFRLLADLSRMDSMDPACESSIRRAMDLCNDKGVSQVVRVIPDPSKDIGLNIMSLFHYRRGVRIITCETLDEAEQLLKS